VSAAPPAINACAGLGGLFYQWNDLDAAAHWLKEGLTAAGYDGVRTLYGAVVARHGYKTLARVCWARDEHEEALAHLGQAEQSCFHQRPPRRGDGATRAVVAGEWRGSGGFTLGRELSAAG